MEKQQINDYKEIISNLDLDHPQQRNIEILWLNFVILMDDLTVRNFFRYNFLNLTTIICGLSVPVLVTFADNTSVKVITAIVGLLAGAGTTINQSYKFNDKWKHFRRIAEEMKIEGASYFTKCGKYKSGHKESHTRFMEEVVNIKNQQIDEYINKVTNTLSADQTGNPDNTAVDNTAAANTAANTSS